MRVNLPVTQREYPFPPGQTLVSTTDLKGRILYCNEAFIHVSGYVREELLGQPHNLIRHPDMPEEAFRDMWATIASGKPWCAAVKNRRKDGDHYWVQANVTPLLDEQGQVTGYMSVRTEPSREMIDGAEALYARMREDAQSGGRLRYVLARGRLLDRHPAARLRGAMQLGLLGKLSLYVGASAITGMAVDHIVRRGLEAPGLGEVAAGLLTATVVGVLGAVIVRRMTVAPLMGLVDFANQLSGGNLTVTLQNKRTDEIGELATALAQLSVNLRSIVRDARDGMAQVRRGSQEIAEGNQDLSARTESQASNLEETAASMEQMTATIRQSTDMAVKAADSASSARDVTERSSAALAALADTMQQISDASRKISDINQVVDSIAFQTNILALNAAVEAARAGEQGRGFAVVAAEVRTLAQRTSLAAKEIRTLIQASSEQVSAGGEQTQSAQKAMDEARQAANEVHGVIEHISHGMREQMLGVQQVNQAVADMDSLTQQNAALVEQVAAASTSLSRMAEAVNNSVSVFRISGESNGQPNAVQLRRQVKSAPAAAAASRAPAAGRQSSPAQAPAHEMVTEGEWAEM